MPELSGLFDAALTAIEPDDDVKNAILARDQVVAVLKKSDLLAEWGLLPILIGSYARNVSIKRIEDVDVFCRLSSLPADMEGPELLTVFNELLEDAFPGNVKTQGRSVQVTFPELDMYIDAVPARPSGSVWEIPCKDPEEGWEETNPLHLGELCAALNARLGEVYVPAVKLMRQTRRSLIADARPRGLSMEVLTYWALEHQGGVDSQAECFVLALEGAADRLDAHLKGDPIMDPAMPANELRMGASDAQLQIFATKLRQAAEDARGALAEEDECEAARVFRRILGKGHDDEYVFPLPEGCSSYGQERSTFAIRPGSDKLPSQETPRFA